MKRLEPTTENDMLRGWAIAEAKNETRWTTFSRFINADTLRRVRFDSELLEDDGLELERAIRRFRRPMIDCLPIRTTWYLATCALEKLAAIEILVGGQSMHCEMVRLRQRMDFAPAGPAYTVQSLAEALADGRMNAITAQADFVAHVSNLRATFDLAKMRGRPVIVGKTIEGPFTLFDGLSRSCAAVLEMQAPFTMPVFLGIGEE